MTPYLTCAIPLAQQNPPELMAGDGVDLLPAQTEAVPDSSLLCIVRIYSAPAKISRAPIVRSSRIRCQAGYVLNLL